MKSSTEEILPIIGTSLDGGYYAGRIIIDGKPYALIVAPKTEGELADVAWGDDEKDVPAAQSWNDGLVNTEAMAAAGSKPTLWARDLRIAGHADWYLPSQDELEILYRNLKPTADENAQWGRSGINLSAIEPTRPYEPAEPAQTQAELFQQGGEQAFETEAYWSSTQHAAFSDYAWCQHFNVGTQDYHPKRAELRVRAVRRSPI